MTNAFAAAFDAYAPVLAADFAAYHIHQVSKMIEKGMTSQEAYRANKASHSFAEADGYRLSSKIVAVKTDWLKKCAAEFARLSVEDFVAKLTKKLGSLTDVEVRRADGGTFVITGKLGDVNVLVEQNQVFKVSAQGTPFHQWPARIYVNGKFTPEASFKKLAA
jgi:hypothetical protein